ncbi:MAG: hypothetical protein H6742_16515 [Alphaproteobacteria bacterium]|nr:hypothetical protein [Alphaproteobacteria bacterium]
MSDTPFVIPEGLVLELGDDGMTIEYAGTIELQAVPAGKLARLASGGGDVVLHASATVGTIEAAGEVRCSGDLEVRDLSSGSARIEGDLTADAVRLDGALHAAGDVRAEQLRATDIDCAALRATVVESSGRIETAGAIAVSRLRAGAVACGESLEAEEVTVEGAANVLGEVQAGTLKAGSLEAGGDIGGGRFELDGTLSSGGALKVDEAHAAEVSADGDITARTVAAASVRTGGALAVSDLRVSERLELSGDLEVGELSATALVIGGNVKAERLSADGLLRLGGSVEADRLEADTIELAGGTIKVRVIAGGSRIVIGAAKIQSDIVIAPHVEIAAGAKGRISVVEANNDPETAKIKGCLSLEDLDELFGNADQFLAERGVSRLDGSAPAPVAEVAEDESEEVAPAEEPALEPEPEPELAEVEEEPEEPEALDDAAADHDASESAVEELEVEVEVDVEQLEESGDEVTNASDGLQVDTSDAGADGAAGDDDPFGWADQMLTEVVAEGAVKARNGEDEDEPMLEPEPEPELEPEPEPAADENPLHGQMDETVQRIVSCYVHTEMPPAVDRLKTLIDQRDYGTIRADITDIWNQLLKFHQKRGMRIQPQVTTTFNTINSLVRKL